MSKVSRRQFLGTAAGAAAASAFPHVWIRPAWAQAKEVRVLAWTHFVPAYDKWFDAFAEQWSTKSGVKVTIDHIPHLQIPAKIAAEIATQSGHDIVQLVGTGTEKWAVRPPRRAGHGRQDRQEARRVDAAGRELLQGAGPTGSSTPSPTSSSTSPASTARICGREIGMPNGPDSWDDLREGGAKLKAKGFPIGIGLAHHDDSRASWRAIMWSLRRLRGRPRTARPSPTTPRRVREALKFNKALYKDAMTPEVLAWDDASNNRLLASGRGSWIHNPISAYRTIEGSEQGAGRQDLRPALAQGPGGAAVLRQLPRLRRHQVLQEPDGAKAFLEALVDSYRDGAKASTGYNMPFLKNYAKPPLPDHQRGPEAEAARAGRRVPLHHRLPGAAHRRPRTRSTSSSSWSTRSRSSATDKMDLEQTVKWAEEKIKAIYAKF